MLFRNNGPRNRDALKNIKKLKAHSFQSKYYGTNDEKQGTGKSLNSRENLWKKPTLIRDTVFAQKIIFVRMPRQVLLISKNEPATFQCQKRFGRSFPVIKSKLKSIWKNCLHVPDT